MLLLYASASLTNKLYRQFVYLPTFPLPSQTSGLEASLHSVIGKSLLGPYVCQFSRTLQLELGSPQSQTLTHTSIPVWKALSSTVVRSAFVCCFPGLGLLCIRTRFAII